eukprot:scaffold36698_cov46-Phaeocystis_antarctica.AAC.4
MICVEVLDLARSLIWMPLTEGVSVDLDRLPLAVHRIQLPTIFNGDAPLRHGILLRERHVDCAPVSGERALVLSHALHLDARHCAFIVVLHHRSLDALHPGHVAAILRATTQRGVTVSDTSGFYEGATRGWA